VPTSICSRQHFFLNRFIEYRYIQSCRIFVETGPVELSSPCHTSQECVVAVSRRKRKHRAKGERQWGKISHYTPHVAWKAWKQQETPPKKKNFSQPKEGVETRLCREKHQTPKNRPRKPNTQAPLSGSIRLYHNHCTVAAVVVVKTHHGTSNRSRSIDLSSSKCKWPIRRLRPWSVCVVSGTSETSTGPIRGGPVYEVPV